MGNATHSHPSLSLCGSVLKETFGDALAAGRGKMFHFHLCVCCSRFQGRWPDEMRGEEKRIGSSINYS